MTFITTLLMAAGGGLAYWQWRKRRQRRREAFIGQYRFPERLRGKLLQRYPHLTQGQGDRVLHGLREYFQLCRMAGAQAVAMPSQAVDVVWHEFILYTRQYGQFCRRGLGRFLHHTPNDALRIPGAASDALARAWRLACARQRLPGSGSPVLPWLFSLDADLGIGDGFRYQPDCGAAHGSIRNADAFCVSHFDSGSGGDSGYSGGDSMGADSTSGDSGSGCGSGCGGGGGD